MFFQPEFKPRQTYKFLALVLSSGLLLLTSLAAADDDDKARLAALLADIQTLQGTFVQDERDELGNRLRILQGDFKMTRELKLKWEIDPPYSQTIISDGQEVLSYDADLEQLVIRQLDLEQLPPFFFLANNPEILEELTVVQLDDESTFYLTDGTSQISVTFSGTTPREISWLNELDQLIKVTFTRLAKNRLIPDAEFAWTPPPGTAIFRHED